MHWFILLIGLCTAGNIGYGMAMAHHAHTTAVRARDMQDIIAHFQANEDWEPRGPGVTPCQQVLGSNGNGRYPRLIAREFMTDMVMAGDPKRNLVCKCEKPDFMVCTIHVKPDSLEETAVMFRLERSDKDRLLPFFVVENPAPPLLSEASSSTDSLMEPPIMFEGGNDPPVLCHIIVEHRIDPVQGPEMRPVLTKSVSNPDSLVPKPPMLARSNSSPSRSNFPTKALPLRLCTQNVCPVTLEPILSHDIVYVLKADAEDIANDKPVPCISAFALKRLARDSSDGTFSDPLKRSQKKFSIANDFNVYVIVGNNGARSSHPGPSGDPGPSSSQAGPSGLHPDPGSPSPEDTVPGSSGSSDEYIPVTAVVRSPPTSQVTYGRAGPSQRGPVEVQAQIAPRGGNPGALRAIVEKVEKEDERVSSANVQNSPHILAKILFLLHFLLLFHFILLSCKKPSNDLQVSDGYLIV